MDSLIIDGPATMKFAILLARGSLGRETSSETSSPSFVSFLPLEAPTIREFPGITASNKSTFILITNM